MSGWLPPGCTDKDIDDAAPQSEPEADDPRFPSERSAQEDEMTIRHAIERMIREGHRARVMWLLKDIVSEYALDSFGLHKTFYGAVE